MRAPALAAFLLVAAACQQAAPAGTTAPAAPWLVSASAQSSYDSNLLQNNQQTLAGWEEDLNALLQWQQVRPTRRLQLQYRPALQMVTAEPGLNSLNQSAAATLALQPAPRWSLQGSAQGSYWERMPTSGVGQPGGLGVAAPLPLLPRTRAVAGTGQLQLGYALSRRSTLEVFGGYNERRFPGAGAWSQTLRGEHGSTSGLRYGFQSTARTQWGVELDHQNFSIGHNAHLAAASLLLRFEHAFTPLTSVQFAAGPEYSQDHETDVLRLNVGGLPVTLTDRLYRVRTYPRIQAAMVHQSRAWRWRLDAERQVSSGGGALPFPTSLLMVSASAGRRVSPAWRVQGGLNASQFQALDGGAQLTGHVRFAAVDLALVHTLGRHWRLEFHYEYFLQRSSGLMPLAPAVNRSVGGIRLRWQWPPIPEGAN
ncbi:MAG: hypothetical protein ACRD0Y_02010 [Terriglobales bacterium]